MVESDVSSGEAPAHAGVFRVAPWVTHDRLDDTVMAIDLETGVYFALDDASADAWTLLASGVALGPAADAVAARYAVDAGRVHADLTAYAEELERSRLLVRDDVAATAPTSTAELPRSAPSGGYAAPTVSRYDDLEALLRLDPVHEVDEAGWPVQRTD